MNIKKILDTMSNPSSWFADGSKSKTIAGVIDDRCYIYSDFVDDFYMTEFQHESLSKYFDHKIKDDKKYINNIATIFSEWKKNPYWRNYENINFARLIDIRKINPEILEVMNTAIKGGIHVDLFANDDYFPKIDLATPKVIVWVNLHTKYERYCVINNESTDLITIKNDATCFLHNLPDNSVDSISINGIDTAIISEDPINPWEYIKELNKQLLRVMKSWSILIMGANYFYDSLWLWLDNIYNDGGKALGLYIYQKNSDS